MEQNPLRLPVRQLSLNRYPAVTADTSSCGFDQTVAAGLNNSQQLCLALPVCPIAESPIQQHPCRPVFLPGNWSKVWATQQSRPKQYGCVMWRCFDAGAALLGVTLSVTNWESYYSGIGLQGWSQGSSPCDWTRVKCNDNSRVALL